MRNILLVALGAIGCLVVGVVGALGYAYYYGPGRELVELQEELSTGDANLAKLDQDNKDSKAEIDALNAQVQQLIATKTDLAKQLDTLKSSGASSLFGSGQMADAMKAATTQQHQERLLLLESRLHLTPDQIAAVQAAMDREDKLGQEMIAKFSSGKINPNDPQFMTEIGAMGQGAKTVDETLNDILTPDQKTAYQQMQTDQQTTSAETQAVFEMDQLAPLLQLTDAQKDQVSTALYQAQTTTQDPNWIQANNANPSDPTAFMEAQAKAKADALSKVLTPDQMAIYNQQAQSELAAQKAMMQNFMKTGAGAAAASSSMGVIIKQP
jgi:chromosome segregation ATPase